MTRTRAARTDEKQWWQHRDRLEPVMGVPSVALVPVPLPDTAANEPEPGVAAEQEVAPSATDPAAASVRKGGRR